MMNTRNKQKGFTLIELIIILAVLSLILAIALPNYLNVQTSSAFRADMVTIDMIEKAESHYHTMNQTHSFDETEMQNTATFQASMEQLANLLKPVEFHVITNVHWAFTNNHWHVAYDTSSPSQNDDLAAPEDKSPDHPEWDQNKNNYFKGDRVVYQNRVFEARHWTNSKPGLFDSHWNEITDQWRSFNEYATGAVVKYEGQSYRAKWWSKNDTPGHATVWELVK